jgi:predicted nuclease with TOPRIM domain
MSEEGETEMYEFSDKANPKEEEEMKELEALKKENTALKAKIEELEKKLSQAKSERKELAELKDELKLLQTKFAETARQLKQERLQRLRAAAEGKLPEEALKQFLVFAERLPEEPLVFAEGEKKEKKNPVEWLAKILAALPRPVAEGALQMGDVKDKKDKEEFDPAKMAQIL